MFLVSTGRYLQTLTLKKAGKGSPFPASAGAIRSRPPPKTRKKPQKPEKKEAQAPGSIVPPGAESLFFAQFRPFWAFQLPARIIPHKRRKPASWASWYSLNFFFSISVLFTSRPGNCRPILPAVFLGFLESVRRHCEKVVSSVKNQFRPPFRFPESVL